MAVGEEGPLRARHQVAAPGRLPPPPGHVSNPEAGLGPSAGTGPELGFSARRGLCPWSGSSGCLHSQKLSSRPHPHSHRLTHCFLPVPHAEPAAERCSDQLRWTDTPTLACTPIKDQEAPLVSAGSVGVRGGRGGYLRVGTGKGHLAWARRTGVWLCPPRAASRAGSRWLPRTPRPMLPPSLWVAPAGLEPEAPHSCGVGISWHQVLGPPRWGGACPAGVVLSPSAAPPHIHTLLVWLHPGGFRLGEYTACPS